MDRIRQAKREIRLNNWQMMYEEYAASGETVRQWCADNNITPKTYYYRIRKLREEALKQAQHKIVPVGGRIEETNTPTANAGVIRITRTRNKRRIAAEYISGAADGAFERTVVMLKEAKFEQVYIVCGYTDMRRSIDGLAGTIKQNFGLEPCSGSLFLFCGKRRDRMKALLWEGDGFLLMYKRLDNGCFQ